MLDKPVDQSSLGVKLMKQFFSRRQNNSSIPKTVEKVGGSLGLIQHSRPSNLPAKNPTEETEHRKQHDEILQEARRREIREQQIRQKKREERLKEEERLSSDSSIWNTQVLPNFQALRNTKETRDLWWKGLPPSIRGRVWKLAINNNLHLTPEIYGECLNDIEIFAEQNKLQSDYLTAIKLDVSRTFPALCVFQENGPLNESLHSILAAYCVLRPEVGYVQGMSFIGAVLTLNLEPTDAFICFANLLDNRCHKAAFSLNQTQMNVYYKVYTTILSQSLPKIYSHFSGSGLSPDFYLLDWVYTIYSKAMPLDVACRIWDIFIRDGDEFLFRTAVGILHLYQDRLLEMDFVRGAQFLTRLPDDLNAEELFDSISQIKIASGGNTFEQMVHELSEC